MRKTLEDLRKMLKEEVRCYLNETYQEEEGRSWNL
jgi:hypothetical protein